MTTVDRFALALVLVLIVNLVAIHSIAVALGLCVLALPVSWHAVRADWKSEL